MDALRNLILLIIALGVLLPASVMADQLLARADLQLPEPVVVRSTAQAISEVLVRKSERQMYLMSGEDVVRSYRISLGDNPEGHKLYEGDERTPEGQYTLDWRNPNSDYHKSIHISYPNERDRDLASAWGLDPGGSIMIHGAPNGAGDLAFAYVGLDWTDGCIAVTNEDMDEIWPAIKPGTPINIVP